MPVELLTGQVISQNYNMRDDSKFIENESRPKSPWTTFRAVTISRTYIDTGPTIAVWINDKTFDSHAEVFLDNLTQDLGHVIHHCFPYQHRPGFVSDQKPFREETGNKLDCNVEPGNVREDCSQFCPNLLSTKRVYVRWYSTRNDRHQSILLVMHSYIF